MVIKEALILSHGRERLSNKTHDPLASIAKFTDGIVFLSTPHGSVHTEKWNQVIQNLVHIQNRESGDRTTESIDPNLRLLEDLRAGFNILLGTTMTCSMLEEMPYPGIGEVVDSLMGSVQGHNEKIVTMPANHTDMCRVSSRFDAGYKKILDAIKYVGGI
jgi:hypothetical protein